MKPEKIIMILVLSFMIWGFNAVHSQDNDHMALFFKANEAYKGGRYKEAGGLYEDILRQGRASEALYYNLGNSYLKDDQVGKAILNYERARLLMPRDSDLESNYRYALSRANLPFLQESGRVAGWIKVYRDYFNADELTLICLGIFVMMGGVYPAGLFFKWPQTKTLAVLFLVGALLGPHFYLLTATVQNLRDQAVATADAEVKYEPNETATRYFSLTEGAKVKILEEEGGWLKIKRLDGKLGWVKASSIEKI